MNIDKNYTAGFMDNVGGFYILRGKHPQFRIITQLKNKERYTMTDMVVNYLAQHEGIKFSYWVDKVKATYQITNEEMLKKLIRYLIKNCYIKKTHQDEVMELILSKEKKRGELR